MELDYEGRGTGLILHEFYDIDGQHEVSLYEKYNSEIT